MFLRHTFPALLWALIIFILCAIPGRDIPHISFLELLSFDKFVHASIFFILVLLFIRGFKLQENFLFLKNKAFIISASLCIVYGGSLEIMQGAIFEERTADIYDFIANSFGALIGTLLFNKINNKFAETKFHV